MSFTSPRNTTADVVFTLKQPQAIALYDSYADAQRAVDYLADQRFPVQNLAIVGTDLKSFERVTGDLSWQKVLGSAVLQGVVWGVMMAGLLWFFFSSIPLLNLILMGVLFAVVASVLMGAISYGMTRGQRDFTSMTQVIATHYEILGEAPVAAQARQLLGGGQTAQRREYWPTPQQRPAQQLPHLGTTSPEPAQPESLGSPAPNYPPPAMPGANTPGPGADHQPPPTDPPTFDPTRP